MPSVNPRCFIDEGLQIWFANLGFRECDLGMIETIVGAIAGAVVGGFLTWCLGRKDRSELRMIHRRGRAPYLVPSSALFNFIYEPPNEGQCMGGWSGANGNVLTVDRNEVTDELLAGDPVIFPVSNDGEAARAVIVKLDGEEISLFREPEMRSARGLQFLKYPFDPSKRGKQQSLTLSFETRDGVRDTHKYVIVHGRRILKRVDPT